MTPILCRGFQIGCKVGVEIRTVYEIITGGTVMVVLHGCDQDRMHDVNMCMANRIPMYTCVELATIS